MESSRVSGGREAKWTWKFSLRIHFHSPIVYCGLKKSILEEKHPPNHCIWFQSSGWISAEGRSGKNEVHRGWAAPYFTAFNPLCGPARKAPLHRRRRVRGLTDSQAGRGVGPPRTQLCLHPRPHLPPERPLPWVPDSPQVTQGCFCHSPVVGGRAGSQTPEGPADTLRSETPRVRHACAAPRSSTRLFACGEDAVEI